MPDFSSAPASDAEQTSDSLRVSVIIPAYNAASTLQSCLDAIAASDPKPYEVILISDGSTDETTAIARSYPGVRVIENDRGHGAAHSRNVGAVAARGNVFLFVDADCVLDPDAVTCGLREIARGEHVIFGSYGLETSAPGFLSQFKNYQHHFTHHNGVEYQTSFWSGCGAVTRRAFEDLQGFDVSLQACEDIEFGYMLDQRGYRVKLVKDMQVEHLKRYSLLKLIRSDLLYRAIPWTRLILAGRAEMGKLNTGRAGRRSVALTGLFCLATAATPFFLPAAALAAVSLAALIGVNRRFLGFLRRQRGWAFTFASVPALLLHFVICGVGFVIGQLTRGYPATRTPAPQYAWSEHPAAAASATASAKGSS